MGESIFLKTDLFDALKLQLSWIEEGKDEFMEYFKIDLKFEYFSEEQNYLEFQINRFFLIRVELPIFSKFSFEIILLIAK